MLLRDRPFVVSKSAIRGLVSVVVALALWEISARLFIEGSLFLAPLSKVILRAAELWRTGELQLHIWVSFQEFLLGFLISAISGIGLGIWMASSKAVEDYLDPWVSMFNAMPTIALGPILILWFGLGIASKVAVIFLVAMFPILINTVAGLTTTDPHLIDVARSFGASRSQIYLKVRLPAALPYIVAGLRNGVARALVGVVVAELFGAKAGLGFLIFVAAQSFDTPALFTGVLILAIFGVAAVEALKWIERYLAPWRFQKVT